MMRGYEVVIIRMQCLSCEGYTVIIMRGYMVITRRICGYLARLSFGYRAGIYVVIIRGI